MTAIAGVYVLFGVDRRVYVGQSANIFRRPTVDLARRLGLDWTIVKYTPNTSRCQRETIETAVHASYRAAGFSVVSVDRAEVTKMAQEFIDFGERAAALRASWVAHPERRLAQAERVRAINARRTDESRSESSKKGWETRRTVPSCPRGTSERTQQRRRAAQARRIQP